MAKLPSGGSMNASGDLPFVSDDERLIFRRSTEEKGSGASETLDGANVWPGAVLRGDVERILLGTQTSFQDNSVAHADPGFPVTIGRECIVGHGVIVHGATI